MYTIPGRELRVRVGELSSVSRTFHPLVPERAVETSPANGPWLCTAARSHTPRASPSVSALYLRSGSLSILIWSVDSGRLHFSARA